MFKAFASFIFICLHVGFSVRLDMGIATRLDVGFAVRLDAVVAMGLDMGLWIYILP